MDNVVYKYCYPFKVHANKAPLLAMANILDIAYLYNLHSLLIILIWICVMSQSAIMYVCTIVHCIENPWTNIISDNYKYIFEHAVDQQFKMCKYL